MSTLQSSSTSPLIVAAYGAASHHNVGMNAALDVIRNSILRGANRSRRSLRQHDVRVSQEDKARLLRFSSAQKYKRLSNELYEILESASRRKLDEDLKARISHNLEGEGTSTGLDLHPSSTGPTCTLRNTFNNSRAPPALDDGGAFPEQTIVTYPPRVFVSANDREFGMVSAMSSHGVFGSTHPEIDRRMIDEEGEFCMQVTGFICAGIPCVVSGLTQFLSEQAVRVPI